MTGWSINGGASIVSVAGGNGLRIESGSVGVDGGAVTAGRRYNVTGTYTASGSGGWAGFGIDFFNAGGAKVGEATGDLANRGSAGGFAVSGLAPAAAVSARLWIYVDAARTVTIQTVRLAPSDCAGAEEPTPEPPTSPPADGGNASPPAVPDTAAGQCAALDNGGFESGSVGWSLPPGSSITSDAHVGSAALRFSGGSVGSMRRDAQAGRQYRLTLQTRVIGSVGWAGVGIDFFDGNGTKLGQAVTDLIASSAYRQTELTADAPAGTAQMKFWLFAGDGITITVDSISLLAVGCDGQVSEAPAQQPDTSPPVSAPVSDPQPVAGSCNSLPDGGFEQGVTGWRSNTALALTADAYAGQQALRLGGGWASTDVTVSMQSGYRISGFAKSSGSGWAGYGIDFLDASGAEIGKISGEFPASSSFGPFAADGAAPAATRSARLWLFSAAGREMTLDNLSVTAAGCAN